MASSTTGNRSYWAATDSSCAARWRCCHSGVRRLGSRRGSSSDRAAHSRNLAANRADPLTSATTTCSTSSGSSSTSEAPATTSAPSASTASGSRSTMPSSECATCACTPRCSRSRAAMASAHGALTCAPNGECTTSRQSPSSSRNRSTRIVRSSGTCLVAACWSAR